LIDITERTVIPSSFPSIPMANLLRASGLVKLSVDLSGGRSGKFGNAFELLLRRLEEPVRRPEVA
jgi:hypothetical protein